MTFDTPLYIYGGIVDLENCETRFIYNLMLASDEFELEELTNKLETLIETTQIDEVIVWNYVIKKISYPKDDYSITMFTSYCYFHLSGIEVLDKIEPYKKISDKQLWKDINQHLIASERPVKSTILLPRSVLVRELPPRAEEPKESFSTIISEEHAAEISTWIDRKTTAYTLTNIPYKFELILRGTQDGFAPQTFWNICHGHACTVVLVKVKETDEIIRGYNPLTWVNNNIKGQWVKTKDSFIFSLKNGDIQNSILSRVKKPQFAILNRSKNDQIKGTTFFDFSMYSDKSNFTLDNYCYCNSHCYGYAKPIKSSSSEYFSIINYEIEEEGKGEEDSCIFHMIDRFTGICIL
ncbi:hypothetical protein Glove_117g72 [Diversispora epigaea]|uniref:TLDc domain-containing protein n=1 Tax=Diversispora epigaea TaxID=1348612 RepID=A0A397J0M3_9GLOM|nr:hypothetical protein Glove_117g72 [Diversispora epigaea]